MITGANGSGKTTLLQALLGRIPVDEGTAGLGSGVRVGEIDQARGLFLGPQPLARAFADAVPDWGHAEVRTLLAKFGLTAEHVPRPADSLSPGERTRAALALLQAREVNLLVLDEPTNHLDLPAIEQLEQAAGQLRRHGAAGHPRPPDAGHRAQHPPLARRRRPPHRALTPSPRRPVVPTAPRRAPEDMPEVTVAADCTSRIRGSSTRSAPPAGTSRPRRHRRLTNPRMSRSLCDGDPDDHVDGPVA